MRMNQDVRMKTMRAARRGPTGACFVVVASFAFAACDSPRPATVAARPAAAPVSEERVRAVAASLATVLIDGAGGRSVATAAIIFPDGYLVTTAPQVLTARSLAVRLPRRTGVMPGELVASDPLTGLSLIHVNAIALDSVGFADSDRVEARETVTAVARQGVPPKTGSIAMSTPRPHEARSTPPYDAFFRTDAITAAHVGGLLLDAGGRVVGINSYLETPGGVVGLAVPSDLARRIINQLRWEGEVEHGYIGVRTTALDQRYREAMRIKVREGVVVQSVFDGGPADRAGLKGGDVVLRVDGDTVVSENDFANSILFAGDGPIDLAVVRDGAVQHVRVRARARGDAIGENDLSGLAGATLAPVPALLANRLGPQSAVGGMLVATVAQGSASRRLGVRSGDVLLRINGRPVGSAIDAQRQFAASPLVARLSFLRLTAGGTDAYDVFVGTGSEAV